MQHHNLPISSFWLILICLVIGGNGSRCPCLLAQTLLGRALHTGFGVAKDILSKGKSAVVDVASDVSKGTKAIEDKVATVAAPVVNAAAETIVSIPAAVVTEVRSDAQKPLCSALRLWCRRAGDAHFHPAAQQRRASSCQGGEGVDPRARPGIPVVVYTGDYPSPLLHRRSCLLSRRARQIGRELA
jgi:hypothetical protein